MKKTDEQKEIAEECYPIPPQILNKINESENAKEYYLYIYEALMCCYVCMENQDFKGAREEYLAMITKLKQELL